MKILFLSQGRKKEDQPDFDVSLRAARTSEGDSMEVRNIPYIGYSEKHGWDGFYREVVRQNSEWRPDVVFFQFYHSGGDGGIAQCCRELKSATNKPLILGSIGDPFYTGWGKYLARPIPRSALDLAANADAYFTTTMGNVADEFVAHGARNLVFVPNAFCPCHFPYWEEHTPSLGREHDVVMLCSKGRLIGRRMVSAIRGNWVRRYVVNKLSHDFGSRFSVFGRNWTQESATGSVPFKDQVKLFRKSRVAVDAPAPILNTTYYSSDRAFFILASGTPLVFFHTPRFERMLRPEEHAFYVYKLSDVTKVCEQALTMSASELDARAERIQAFVKERHLIDHRVDTIISTVEALVLHRRGILSKDASLRNIRMHHFLPEVDMEDEYSHCVANWVG